jgi:hypothetical protein
VRVWDSRASRRRPAALREHVPAAELLAGALDAGALAGVERVLKSPGLAPDDARIAGLLDAARAAGIAVQGELDLFVAALAALRHDHDYAPKIIAVTGTNGKTTTTAMTTSCSSAAASASRGRQHRPDDAADAADVAPAQREHRRRLPGRGCSSSRASSSRPARRAASRPTRRRSST